MIEIVDQPIETDVILQQVQSNQAGAVVLFLGTTREYTDGRQTHSLDYECYESMARSELARLEAEAQQRWPILNCVLVHRVGHLALGEASVAVAVSSPHRDGAFEAARWLIDTIKQVVPIWKKENWADGTSQWVHPGLVTGEGQPKLESKG